MKVLTTLSFDEIMESIRKGEDLKGIAHANHWENATPITLFEILQDMVITYRNTLWVQEVPDVEQEVAQDEQESAQDEREAAQDIAYAESAVASGQRIRKRMEELGITTMDLAGMLGMTETTTSLYVGGSWVPEGLLVPAIAKALKTTPDYLMGTEDPSPEPEESEQLPEDDGIRPIGPPRMVTPDMLPTGPDEPEAVMLTEEDIANTAPVRHSEPAADADDAEKEPDKPITVSEVTEGWKPYPGTAMEEPKVRHTSMANLGKWAEYQGRALTKHEQNEAIFGMTEEGYSVAVIASVVRVSQQTIRNRLKKMEEEKMGGGGNR